MTVAVQQPFNLYGPVAPGAVLFTFDFKITDAADLVVTVNDGAPLESGIDYIVTGVGDNDGGDIRLSIGLSGGQMVLLKRQMTLDRQTDYQQNGDFISSTVNNDFDRIWLALQQFAQDLKRSFKLPFATFTNQELTQTPAQRANKAVVFDADGNMSIGADNYIDQAAAAAASANAAQVAAAQTGSDVVTTGTNAATAVNAAQAAIAAANSIDPTNLVHRTGTEAIGGQKNFTLRPVVGTASPGTNDAAAASTAYADNAVLAKMNIKVRHAIQYGPTTGVPAVSNLIPQSQINNTLATGVTAKFSAAPTLLSLANSFNADGSQNDVNVVLNADLTITGLAANSTNIIAYDKINNVLVKTTILDTDTKGGAPAITSGLYTLDYENWKMYLGNGAAAVQVQHIILAEVDTDTTKVTAIRCRAYRRECITPQNALPAVGGSVIVNHNIGTNQVNSTVDFVCATASDGYQVGDIHHQISTRNTESVPFNWNFRGKNVAQVTTGANNAYAIDNPANGIDANLTAANWRIVGVFKGRY